MTLAEYLLRLAAFDEGSAKRKWTHKGPPGDWHKLTNAEICAFGASVENQKLRPLIEALVRCVEATETSLKRCSHPSLAEPEMWQAIENLKAFVEERK